MERELTAFRVTGWAERFGMESSDFAKSEVLRRAGEGYVNEVRRMEGD
jgi:hypothetical protein